MKRAILFCVIASILLFIISFFLNDVIHDFLFSFFDNRYLVFVVPSINFSFVLAIKMCLSIALVPMLLLLIWQFGNINAVSTRLFSIVIVLAAVFGAVALNIIRIQSQYSVITKLGAVISYPMENVHFEYAVLLGTILGCIIGFFIFKTAKNKTSGMLK